MRSVWRSLPLLFWIVTGLVLAGPSPSRAELREVEAIGVVPIGPRAPSNRAPREAAMRNGVARAVRSLALELVPGLPPQREAALDEALGSDPFQFASRFRIVEDRGEQVAELTSDPLVEAEYVVVVSVHIDVARIEQRLAERGLIAQAGAPAASHSRVYLILEGLQSHDEYAAVRDLLIKQLRSRSAMPVLMERGRAVLEIDGDQGPEQLLRELLAAAPPDLTLTPIGIDGPQVAVRVGFKPLRGEPKRGAGPPAARGSSPAGAAIDTTGQNRY